MALKKRVITKNGLPLEYHRVALVNIEPNQQITVLVHSYFDESARQYEKDWAAGNIEGEPRFPYVAHEYVNMEYGENVGGMSGDVMTCAYGLLKKHKPELADAENV